jgi:hypothetical protein
MKSVFIVMLTFFSTFLLATVQNPAPDPKPIPFATTADPILERAILRSLRRSTFMQTGVPVRYLPSRYDLNGDSKEDVFVLLVRPADCVNSGCSALLFEPSLGDYKLVANITGINTPVFVSSNQTKGWNDIVVYVSGGGVTPAYHVLKFDGTKYPSHPSVAPQITPAKEMLIATFCSSDCDFSHALDILPGRK